MPVVVVTGARQTGKSTLVRSLLPGDRTYLSLDDLDVRDQASNDPDALVSRADRLVLDEVQRTPDLLIAVKRAVDEDRTQGQFVLTGSSNLLLMRDVSESLAGRASYVTLWPMTRHEIAGQGRAGPWSALFDVGVEQWPRVLADQDTPPADWRDVARRGGYPVPALHSPDADARGVWFDGYVRTYLERDLQDLSSIDNLVDFRRLMRATCLRVGNIVNQTELGRDVQLPQPTVHRWLNLLETSYQLVRVPAYSVNRTRRLIKTPKAFWADTGLALHLAGTGEPHGAHLENHVLSNLLVWRDAHVGRRPEVYYWRTSRGEEVDFVVESGGELIAVEVKSGRRGRVSDAVHLRTFMAEYRDVVRGCLLLHGGDVVEPLGGGVVSAPWWTVA